MSKRVYAAALLFVVFSLFFGSCSGGSSTGPGPSLPKPLTEQYAIDGIVDLTAVGTVHEKTIDILDSFGKGTVVVQTTTLRYAMANDERHLYIAMVWSDATPTAFDPTVGLTDFDGVVIMFDYNGDGIFEENEDARRLVMHIYSSGYSDLHNVSSGHDDNDAVGDGLGK